MTSKLLTKNPEYYTAWNHRRRILQKLFLQEPASVEARLSEDLEFLLPIIKKFPKCYWIWSHRRWLLAQASAHLSERQVQQFWQAEFALVAIMLSRDNRNFHGWNYRRRVVSELQKCKRVPADALSLSATDNAPATSDGISRDQPEPPLCEKEYAYTSQMVRGNLSNFSAWHQRSMLLPQVLNVRSASRSSRRELFDSELAFIKNALFTDPYDQSLWFYHQYLMCILLNNSEGGEVNSTSCPLPSGNREQWASFTNHDREQYLSSEIGEIKELLDDTDDCKWIYQSLLSLAQSYLDVEGGNQGNSFTTIELRNWLSRLNELDPLRKGRWIDWERKLGL